MCEQWQQHRRLWLRRLWLRGLWRRGLRLRGGSGSIHHSSPSWFQGADGRQSLRVCPCSSWDCGSFQWHMEGTRGNTCCASRSRSGCASSRHILCHIDQHKCSRPTSWLHACRSRHNGSQQWYVVRASESGSDNIQQLWVWLWIWCGIYRRYTRLHCLTTRCIGSQQGSLVWYA